MWEWDIGWTIELSKLTRKFVTSISAIFVFVVILSLALNKNFVQRYLVYQEKQEMHRICERILAHSGPLTDTINKIEDTEDVVIAQVENTQNNVLMNERLQEAFLNKGISLKKYWLWDQDQQDAITNGVKMRIYYQEKLHYSLMVAYMPTDDDFLAIGKIIPSIDQTISLVNRVTVMVFIGAIFIMVVLITILVHKIVAPLKEISEAAKSISNLDFKTVKIHTNDELEILAEDMNHMSRRLKEAQETLELKNKQMEELLSNVSHDLKTPVALIKAYASGIQDGIDDGSFIDTIIIQNNRMEQMIERLLSLAKVNDQDKELRHVNISERLTELIEDYRFQAKNKLVFFDCEVEDNLIISANEDAVHMIMSNLLSNAVKYTSGERISISLKKKEEGILLEVKNQVHIDDESILNRLWEPFFVAEKSRNKDMSGTGLGLAIVAKAAKQYGYSYGCTLENHIITFFIGFQ